MEQNVCILGTSPLMALIYKRLRKNFDISIYEQNKNIGGAWQYHTFQDVSFSVFNNIIIPENKTEDEIVLEINTELEKYGCRIISPTVPIAPIYPYEAKNVFLHDFTEFYNELNLQKAIYNLKINEINILEKKVLVNSKSFKYLFLPENFDVNIFKINNTLFSIKPKTVISSHLTAFIESNCMPLCTYDDNFDNVFDRAQIKKLNNKYIFTGRVRKEHKTKKVENICYLSSFLSKQIRNIYHMELNYYKHHILDDETLHNLRDRIINHPVSIVATKQFNNGYLHLNESINKIKKFNILNEK
tara:strand:- start:1162 stop:2064 length:903 start_codon:yes stop_codon:yes gene_type:complete